MSRKNQAGRRRKPIPMEPPAPIRVRQRGAAQPPPLRTDHRSERTVEDILAATFKVIAASGASKLSVSAVCEEAGVSRGTLYRYFASKDELVEAATRRLREQTDEAVEKATAGHADPAKRFRGFIDYTLHGIETNEASHLLASEPEFLLKYFAGNFDHFNNRVRLALDPVFDSWDDELGAKIDRDLICELFVRFALSEILVPLGPGRDELPRRMMKLVRQVRGA